MRSEFSAKVKAAALKRCMDEKGIPRCEGVCGRSELKAGNINYDHDEADGLGGAATLENCKVLCKTCHAKKTFGHDNPIMQKADRSRKTIFRVKNRKGPPMPGTKASGWKQKIGGGWERR